MAHVVPELDFDEILRKMFPGNVDMGSANAVLDAGPETFKRVNVMNAVNPVIGAVVDPAMPVAEPCKLGVGSEFIAADRRTRSDVLKDMPELRGHLT